MSASGTFRQDMPPPGGYKQIPFERIAAKKLLRPKTVVLGIVGSTLIGYYMWKQDHRRNMRLDAEMRSAHLALQPMLHAEKDRGYLIQLRKNRDEEARLMADVPGWVVGTYYGEKVFKSRPADEWIDVTAAELFVHGDPEVFVHYRGFFRWS